MSVDDVIARLNAKIGYNPNKVESALYKRLFELADLSVALKSKLVFKIALHKTANQDGSGAVSVDKVINLGYSDRYKQFSIFEDSFHPVYTVNRFGETSGNGKYDHNVEALAELVNLSDKSGTELLAEIGVMLGSCCYCGKDLSTAESRTVGYGPSCAKRHGLPWGHKSTLSNSAKRSSKKAVAVAVSRLGDSVVAAFNS